MSETATIVKNHMSSNNTTKHITEKNYIMNHNLSTHVEDYLRDLGLTQLHECKYRMDQCVRSFNRRTGIYVHNAHLFRRTQWPWQGSKDCGMCSSTTLVSIKLQEGGGPNQALRGVKMPKQLYDELMFYRRHNVRWVFIPWTWQWYTIKQNNRRVFVSSRTPRYRACENGRTHDPSSCHFCWATRARYW